MEFKQKYCKSWQILKWFSISKATFYRFKNEWISHGNERALMGKVILGPRLVVWDPVIFMNWLQEHKANKKVKYDYELQDKLIAIQTLKKIKQ